MPRCRREQVLSLEYNQLQGVLALLPDVLLLVHRPGEQLTELAMPAASYAEWSPSSQGVFTVRQLRDSQRQQRWPALSLAACLAQVTREQGDGKHGFQLAAWCAATGARLWRSSLSTLLNSRDWGTYVRTPQLGAFCASPCGKHMVLLDDKQGLRIIDAATGGCCFLRP